MPSSQSHSARRALLKQVISASTLAMVAASGLLLPQRVLAHWPKSAFSAATIEDVLLALMGHAEVIESDAVTFATGKPAPSITQGESVTVEIASRLSNIQQVVVLVDNNPNPLAMSFELTDEAMLPLRSRIKIVEGQSQVIAIIRAEDKLYKATRDVKVSVGGTP